MDRSGPPLYAAADPPTVKSEPPGPTPGGECKPDQSAGEAVQADPGLPPVPAPVETEADTSSAEAGADDGPPEPPHEPHNVEVAASAYEQPEPHAEHPSAAAHLDLAPSDVPLETSDCEVEISAAALEQPEVHKSLLSVEADAAAGLALAPPDARPETPNTEEVAFPVSVQPETHTERWSVEPDTAVEPVSAWPQPEPPTDHSAPAVVAEALPDVAQALLLASAPPAQASSETHRPSRPLLENWDRERVKSIGVRAAKVTAIVFSAWFTVVLFLIVVYRFVNPPFSSLMVMHWLTGTSIHRQWVPVDEISPNLVRAVIASEDGRFCHHWGIDFAEVAAAIKRSSGGVPRGASTITMQVAKNLFLWPAKSYLRKIIEVPLTYAIELMWPKRRIMEVYLNIAEWGPGVFGAEAASQEHFNRSAARLSARQAAQLAVVLPNPFVRDAGDPGPWTARRASIIQRRAARSPEEATCVLSGD
jgi:monofunctional biosynthetic peptidoglycan transglycosylase